jgi:hypothetical protein
MRRIAIISAGAALALALVVPAVAGATGKSSTPQSTTISAQSTSLDAPITAQGKRGHHGDHDRDHGDRHGRSRHGYYGGGRCYGCDGPGSRCGRYGCDYAYPGYGYGYGCGYGYYGCGGYYGGGYGCNFDYPCGPPYEYNCSKYTGPDGKPPADSGCKYDQKCDCYYHSSQPPPEAGAQPGPDQGAQPPPDQNAQPAPDQNAQPAPDQGAQPPPDQGDQPEPGEGGEQPRPY